MNTIELAWHALAHRIPFSVNQDWKFTFVDKPAFELLEKILSWDTEYWPKFYCDDADSNYCTFIADSTLTVEVVFLSKEDSDECRYGLTDNS